MRPVARSANAADWREWSTRTAAVPSADSSAWRSLGRPGVVPRSAISRRLPSSRSTSTTRHVVGAAPSVPATSSRARRPSGSTTALIGSPPTSAPPSTSRTAPSASTVRTHGPESPVPAVSTAGSVGDPVVTRQPDQSSSRSKTTRGGSSESTGQLRIRPPVKWLPRKTVRPPSVREPSGPSRSVVSVRITRRCSTSEASSASRVCGVSLSRKPWAASRYVRSSDSAVPDRAASRFASATREVSSATAVARSAACWERTASTAVTMATTSTAASPAGQPPQPAPASGLGQDTLLCGTELRVGARLGHLEEIPLSGGQLVVRCSRPVEGRAEPGPAVQLVVRAAAALPLLGGRRQVPADGAPGGVVVQPSGQSGPPGQQRLVRDIEPLAVEGQQPTRHEAVDHRPAQDPRGHCPGRVRRGAPVAG